MTTYAKVTIKQYIDSPELDMLDYIAQHGEPTDHRMVCLWIVDEVVYHDKPLRSEFGTLAGMYYFSQVKMRRPKNDDWWVSFRFYTLWEVIHYKSYCWEYGTYEYDSEAYCVGLLDERKWTPEALGLVDKAEYE